jgi:hypothetical protein
LTSPRALALEPQTLQTSKILQDLPLHALRELEPPRANTQLPPMQEGQEPEPMTIRFALYWNKEPALFQHWALLGSIRFKQEEILPEDVNNLKGRIFLKHKT